MYRSIVEAVRQHRIIAILRGVPPEKAAPVAQALYEGGIRLLEVTFNQNASTNTEDTARSIQSVQAAMEGRLLVGAGTVLTTKQARIAAASGARFILSPDTNREVIEETVRLGLTSVPGAMTPTEIAQAYRWGGSIVKLFPAGNLGPGYMRAVRAPLSHIPLIAVGGVDEHNLADFLAAGAIGAGIGSHIVDNKLVEAGRYEELTALARRYVGAAETDWELLH